MGYRRGKGDRARSSSPRSPASRLRIRWINFGECRRLSAFWEFGLLTFGGASRQRTGCDHTAQASQSTDRNQDPGNQHQSCTQDHEVSYRELRAPLRLVGIVTLGLATDRHAQHARRTMLSLKDFFDGEAATSSTRRQSSHSLRPGEIGDWFIGASPCLRANVYIPISAFSLLNNAFGAASGSRWHVFAWLGSVRP